METLVILTLFAAWGGLCFWIGRIISVNKAINRHWPDFQEWQIEKRENEIEND